jgi:hypothetical protein
MGNWTSAPLGAYADGGPRAEAVTLLNIKHGIIHLEIELQAR